MVICSFVLVEVLRGRNDKEKEVVYDKIKEFFVSCQPKTVFIFVDIKYKQLYNPIKKEIDKIWQKEAQIDAIDTDILSIHKQFREQLKKRNLSLTKARLLQRKKETCFFAYWQKQ
jgi:hypothetical protein